MAGKLSRRDILHGVLVGGAVGGVVLATRRFPGPIHDIYDVTDALNYSLHDLLLATNH